MTALTNLPPATRTTTQAGPALSGPLNSWLLAERSDRVAVETIRASKILREEAEAAIPALRQAALTTATHDQIKTVISTRFALFPPPIRNEQEWAAWWSDYFDALSDQTPFAVEAGMAAWVRQPDAEFMCKPGKLRELAMTTPNENRWAKAHKRATDATYVAPVHVAPEPRDESNRPTSEEVAAIMADFHKVMADKDPIAKIQAKRRPPPCARVDKTGVSEEMRQLLARSYQ